MPEPLKPPLQSQAVFLAQPPEPVCEPRCARGGRAPTPHAEGYKYKDGVLPARGDCVPVPASAMTSTSLQAFSPVFVKSLAWVVPLIPCTRPYTGLISEPLAAPSLHDHLSIPTPPPIPVPPQPGQTILIKVPSSSCSCWLGEAVTHVPVGCPRGEVCGITNGVLDCQF